MHVRNHLNAGRGSTSLSVQQLRQMWVCWPLRENLFSEGPVREFLSLAATWQWDNSSWGVYVLQRTVSLNAHGWHQAWWHMPIIVVWLRSLKLKQTKELKFSLRRQSPGPQFDFSVLELSSFPRHKMKIEAPMPQEGGG